MVRLTLSLLTLLCAAPAAAHAGSWRRPLDGPLLRGFALGADRYARGQHRGIDLGATPGSAVRSACAGQATFAGRVPRGGVTVSVRCGALIATYQQLGSSAVGRGQVVAPGARVGAVGSSRDPRTPESHVHLGVRVAATGRYMDPLTLLGGGRHDLPLAPPDRRPPRGLPFRSAPPPPRAAARARAPRAVPLGRAPVAAPRLSAPASLAPAQGPFAAAEAQPAPAVPLAAWLGLASVALALPVGGVLTLRRRRRRPEAIAVGTR